MNEAQHNFNVANSCYYLKSHALMSARETCHYHGKLVVFDVHIDATCESVCSYGYKHLPANLEDTLV